MKYRMIVTDMDDTLLNSKGEVSPENREAIIGAQEKGVKFILASGRPTFAMKDIAKSLKLDEFGSYMLSYNGAIITKCNDWSEWDKNTLSQEEAHQLYEFSVDNDVHIITYLDDKVVSETESEYIDVELELTGMPHKKVECFKSTVSQSVVKCIMLEEPAYLKTVEKKLKNKLGNEFSVAISKPFFLEVMKNGIDKGASLSKLAKHLGIGTDEIIAIGDSYNDITMLELAGLPVAVENAKSEVKDAAKYISLSNEEHGVAKVIDKFIFE